MCAHPVVYLTSMCFPVADNKLTTTVQEIAALSGVFLFMYIQWNPSMWTLLYHAEVA